MNVRLFDTVEKTLLGYSSEFSFVSAKRYISLSEDDRERRIASDAEIVAKYDVGQLKAIVVSDEHEGEIILFSGPRYAIQYSDALSPASAGECLLFYDSFPPDLVSSPAECYDICSFSGDDGYNGHEYRSVFGCFLPVYARREGSKAVCRTRRLASILLDSSRMGPTLGAGLVEAYSSVEYKGCHIERSLLSSMAEVGKARQFLDLYRILEHLYFKIYCKELYDASRPSISEAEFYANVEAVIGWRPREIDSLSKLIYEIWRESPAAVLSALQLLGETSLPSQELSASRSLANKIYSARNDLVHWRSNSIASISRSDMQTLSMVVLVLISGIPDKLLERPVSCGCCGAIDLI